MSTCIVAVDGMVASVGTVVGRGGVVLAGVWGDSSMAENWTVCCLVWTTDGRGKADGVIECRWGAGA